MSQFLQKSLLRGRINNDCGKLVCSELAAGEKNQKSCLSEHIFLIQNSRFPPPASRLIHTFRDSSLPNQSSLIWQLLRRSTLFSTLFEKCWKKVLNFSEPKVLKVLKKVWKKKGLLRNTFSLTEIRLSAAKHNKIFPPAAGQSTAKIWMNSSAAKEIKIYLLTVFYPPARRRLISQPKFLSGRRILPVLSAEEPWHKFVILSGGKPDLLVTLL